LITQIEQAICQRLTEGLGHMTRTVTSYGGEIDDDLGRIVRELPAAWVTFGGISKTESFSLAKRQYKPTGQFVVIVGDYSTRSEATSRRGGVNVDEVGCYRLVYAVRRLLTGQDLGLKINPLMPGRVRTLFNTQFAERALSVFACEFDTQWLETALIAGTWPEPTQDKTHADWLFNQYGGQLTPPDPDLLRVGTLYDPPGVGSPDDPVDLINIRKKP
jgi:phage gp37-like protein